MLESFYPVLMSEDIEKSAEFFMNIFDFKETFTSDWYISLKGEKGFEVALIHSSHETIPDKYKTKCNGLILNFEVDNVDTMYEKIITMKDVNILLEIRNEDFGQRHFMIESPDEIIVDVIQVIPPSEAFLAQYVEMSDEDETK